MNKIITDLQNALSDIMLVQSFSGVRTQFGNSGNISESHEALVTSYGYSYADMILKDIDRAIFIIGRDPRPSGKTITSALIKGFKLAGCINEKYIKVINLGIITTPLIETAIRALNASGGAMVTASHNPITDNGFKFLTGVHLADQPDQAPPGALLSASAMEKTVNKVKDMANGNYDDFLKSIKKINEISYTNDIEEDHSHRVKAERAYLDFLSMEWNIQPHCLKPLTLGPILVDPNGGAGCGIAARVLEHFGVRAIEINAEIGYPEHAIDTDSIDPASGKHMMLRVARAANRNGARLGIAFDYDADRGNIVLPGMDESVIIQPQTVAALNIALALAHRDISGKHHRGKLAIVVSEATSGASNRVAELFGAEVFTVETGEINVVTKMHQLKKLGYDVPIGVEGANGGSIFGEATCRDGLMTSLCASIADENPALAEEWHRILKRSGNNVTDAVRLRLPEILESIPVNSNIMLKIKGPSKHHGEIKRLMEKYFSDKLWAEFSNHYTSYKFGNYEGINDVMQRSGDESGGWRVILESDTAMSFIFARGSRTEAGIWRMIIDEPDHSKYEMLYNAGISMINAAMDGKADIK